MQKILSFMIVAGVITGCSYYDYYRGGVRYVQRGDNCVYYSEESSEEQFSEKVEEFDDENRIVYKNTRCEDLFARDNAGRMDRNKRHVLAPATVANRKPKPVAVAKPVEKPCCECKAELVPVSGQFFALTAK
ncbi:MAG: hypothetical protein IJL21_02310 [Alphaproteobacteria bacterium]|jgi:uncharacterized protein with PIN domain|nr:hypothetical protein [Alphaproteobacteria bacterium]MBQ6027361.1 hypothetical protein [Alphaproteobacteria bacterium]